jgi:NitT/TauT family transport system ATP-binding protein
MNIQFPNSPTTPDRIELRDIIQSYTDSKTGKITTVIEGLNLLIEDIKDVGEFVVILGPSGCGKSTILRHIAGLQEPTSGLVLINGAPRTDDLAIGMVFQQYSALPWYSVLDNVALSLILKGVPQEEARSRSMEMLKVVGLEKEAYKYAKIGQLSGGQLQRVAIAASLIAAPELMLMDEPFGALDPRTRRKMQLMLAQLWLQLQSTIVFVTHDVAEAVFLGDVIYLMSTSPAQIVAKYEVKLPLERTLETRRSTEFLKQTYEVEDLMTGLENATKV